MRGLGWPELVIILVVVLIIFGAGKLPEIGGAMGKAIRQFKKEKDGAAQESAPKKKAAAKKVKEAKQG